jgi:hypothetical protein
MAGHVVEAEFRCSVCSEIAATLALLPRDARHPDALKPGVATLVTDGFMGKTREQVGAEQEESLRAALERSDASKLYELNRLWAPFYCAQCRRSYCIPHWQVETKYDDEFPGFYDCSYGTCPQGHRRMIDD